jgi:HSP20 family protein
MQETMNRMLDRPGYRYDRYEDVPVLSNWSPAVDVREEDGQIVLTAELPGVPLEDIEISVENNVLSISGERRVDEKHQEGSYHWRERAWGTFRRTFTLPSSVDRDAISAGYKDGVLNVRVPQREEAKPKQIAINAA